MFEPRETKEKSLSIFNPQSINLKEIFKYILDYFQEKEKKTLSFMI